MDKRLFIAQQIRALFKMLLNKVELDDSEKMQFADIYPIWKKEGNYELNSIYSYGVNQDDETQLWQCTIAHQYSHHLYEDPSVVPALWKKIGFTEEGYPIWTQPLGATDAYLLGDRVSYNGHIYESIHNGANTWPPDVYGWTLIE